MRIQTPRESRREIVGRISERLGIPARYEGAPGFAYTIGEITVERDGGIVSGNDALLEIAFDGVIDASERTDFMEALDFLRKLEESINDIILIGLGKEKAAPGATGSGQARK